MNRCAVTFDFSATQPRRWLHLFLPYPPSRLHITQLNGRGARNIASPKILRLRIVPEWPIYCGKQNSNAILIVDMSRKKIVRSNSGWRDDLFSRNSIFCTDWSNVRERGKPFVPVLYSYKQAIRMRYLIAVVLCLFLLVTGMLFFVVVMVVFYDRLSVLPAHFTLLLTSSLCLVSLVCALHFGFC